MKRKWMVVVWALALAAFLGVFWYQMPCRLGLDAGSVSRLVLTDGDSGLRVELTDQEEIAHVVEKLNSVTLHREGAAREGAGWRFSVSVYRTGETAEDAERYLIDDPKHIRTGGFQYTVAEGSLDEGYLQTVFQQAKQTNSRRESYEKQAAACTQYSNDGYACAVSLRRMCARRGSA